MRFGFKSQMQSFFFWYVSFLKQFTIDDYLLSAINLKTLANN